jgi:hypothetical protein
MGNVGHFDPLGETEPSDTMYTLAVHVPPQPNSLSELLPKFPGRTLAVCAKPGRVWLRDRAR